MRGHADATFQAGRAAAAVADAFAQGESDMVGLSHGFTVAALEADPSRCQITFAITTLPDRARI